MSKNSKSGLRLLALSLTLTCAACASDPQLTPLNRDLPQRPAGLSEPVPDPSEKARVGADARILLAETKAALAEANAKNACGWDWYDEVRDFYRGIRSEGPDDGADCVVKATAKAAPVKQQTRRKANR